MILSDKEALNILAIDAVVQRSCKIYVSEGNHVHVHEESEVRRRLFIPSHKRLIFSINKYFIFKEQFKGYFFHVLSQKTSAVRVIRIPIFECDIYVVWVSMSCVV